MGGLLLDRRHGAGRAQQADSCSIEHSAARRGRERGEARGPWHEGQGRAGKYALVVRPAWQPRARAWERWRRGPRAGQRSGRCRVRRLKGEPTPGREECRWCRSHRRQLAPGCRRSDRTESGCRCVQVSQSIPPHHRGTCSKELQHGENRLHEAEPCRVLCAERIDEVLQCKKPAAHASPSLQVPAFMAAN